jgi:hypothetical protein
MVRSLSYNRPRPRAACRAPNIHADCVVWLARVPSSDTDADVSSAVVAQRGAREVNVDGLLVAPVREPASLRSSALHRQETSARSDGRQVFLGGTIQTVIR